MAKLSNRDKSCGIYFAGSAAFPLVHSWPQEFKKLFVVLLPEKCYFSVPRNLKVRATRPTAAFRV